MAAKYLTMVGQLQWLVILVRFDIHTQVATMSMFRAAPSQGHMDRLKRVNLTKILIGHTLYMAMTKKSFLMTCQNHLVRQ